MIEIRYMRLFLVILLWLNPCVKVIADSIHDFHDVRGRESTSSNLSLDQVVVRGASTKMLTMMVFIQLLLILFKVQLELNLNGIMRVIISTGPFVKLRHTQILDLG